MLLVIYRLLNVILLPNLLNNMLSGMIDSTECKSKYIRAPIAEKLNDSVRERYGFESFETRCPLSTKEKASTIAKYRLFVIKLPGKYFR